MLASNAKNLAVHAKVSYGGFTLDAAADLALDGVTGLFGPSGSGKSTLLRIISGLERTAASVIHCSDQVWQDASHFVAPHRRPVGYVFQDARLFPHLTVGGNLQFAAARSAARHAALGFDAVVAAFDLGALLSRQVDALSGGERQRVAIARTLLTQPELLLLDEPLAALDAGRKGEILPYLEDLWLNFGVPIIYVSHAIDEIGRLCDRVVVLNDGRVSAMGAATEVLNQLDVQAPQSRFDAMTILETVVTRHLSELKLTELDFRGQAVVVPILAGREQGDRVRLHVRAGDVAVAIQRPVGVSIRNVLTGTTESIQAESDDPFAIVTININGAPLRAELTRQAIEELELVAGAPVYALLKTASFDRRH